MTHSPAPWHYSYNFGRVYDADNKFVAECLEEDINLIAASPDLLAACKLAANILEHSYDVNEAEYPQSIECLKHLKEVISKAEPNEIT